MNDDVPLRKLHVDVRRNTDLSEHQQRVNSASTASTTGTQLRGQRSRAIPKSSTLAYLRMTMHACAQRFAYTLHTQAWELNSVLAL